MTKVLFVFSIFFSLTALSEGEKFEERKNEALRHIESKMGSLQDLKSCISAASNRGQMKDCRKEHKGHMKELKGERMENKIRRLEERKKALESKKNG